MQLRHDAPDIMCDDRNCTETDEEKCCGESGSCITFHCPDEFVHILNAKTQTCNNEWTCTKQDIAKCCTERATCAEHVCPATLTKKQRAPFLLCLNRTCSDVDDEE